MAYINPGGSTNTPNSQNSNTSTSSTTGGVTTGVINDWHKALLWFLGAVAMVAIAGPAPKIATYIMLILIVLVLLAHWNDTYKHFLGLK